MGLCPGARDRNISSNEKMRLQSTAAFWLLPLLATLSKAAKLPVKDYVRTHGFNISMETGLELYGSSGREKRSSSIEDLIRKADDQATSFRKLREEEELHLQEDFNAIDKILPAPLAINLLSQIILIAADSKTDFEPVCGNQDCKHLTHPESFKTSLLQLSHSAFDAFNTAHVNMDVIDRNMRHLPTEVRSTLIMLLTDSERTIKLLLPDKLSELRRIAKSSRDRAHENVVMFNKTSGILAELIEGGQHAQKNNKDEKAKKELEIMAAEEQKKFFEEQKKKAEDQKKELKEKIVKFEAAYNKAIKDIPTGTQLMTQHFTEQVLGALGDVISIIPNVVREGVNKELGIRVTPTKEGTTSSNNDQKDQPQIPKFPSCPGYEALPLPKQQISITNEQKMAFAIDTNNMQLAIPNFSNYVESVFHIIEGTDPAQPRKYSLVANAEGLTDTTKTILLPYKNHLENTGADSAPMFMKSTAVSYMNKMFQFMDKIVQAKNVGNSKPEDFETLHKEAAVLLKDGRCFNNWVTQILDLSALQARKPFGQKEKEKPKSFTEMGVENAKYKVELAEKKLQEAEERFEHTQQRLLQFSHNVTETIIQLGEFNAALATVEEILDVLRKALKELNQLKDKWEKIRQFFQAIENIIDVSLGDKLDLYIKSLDKRTDNLIHLRTVDSYKNDLFAYIQDINTQGHLIGKMTSTYLTVSNKYILPPVTQLGLMLHVDEKQRKKLKVDIGAKTAKASREMLTILKNQKDEFLTSARARRNELIKTYQPIIDQIPEDRQREIEMEVQAVTADIPQSLIEKRKKGAAAVNSYYL